MIYVNKKVGKYHMWYDTISDLKKPYVYDLEERYGRTH